MKRILLDTHAFIWALENPALLSPEARELIETKENRIFISQISFYEIASKQTLNKIALSVDLAMLYEETSALNFEMLPLQNEHIIAYTQLPLLPDHRDPFDRLLIATASYENLEIISSDQKFTLYPEWVNVIF